MTRTKRRSCAWALIAASASASAGVFACDRDRALLERDLAAAESHLAELDRVDTNRKRGTAWVEAGDLRLPDGPRGALTASIAAEFPNAELDGTLNEQKTGFVWTDPLELVLPAELDHLTALFEAMKKLGRVWAFDSVKKEGSALRLRFHAYTFNAVFTKPNVDVGENENTPFSKDRDQLRDRTRAALAQIEQKWSALDRAEIERYWKAELKTSLLADLTDRTEKIEDDAQLVLGVFKDASLIPAEWTIGIRLGRRVCAIAIETADEKKRFLAIAASKPGTAIDARERELVLKSGRVCTVSVGTAINGA